MNVVILDYGVGNIGNLMAAFRRMGVETCLTADQKLLLTADLVVLPGVGAFAEAMASLTAKGLDQVLKKRVQSGGPVLGICLGMQLLCQSSEEYGNTQGLGFISGVLRPFSKSLRVPHMGWNTLDFADSARGEARQVYFVHSYRLTDYEARDMVAFTEYGGHVPAWVQRGCVTGLQFHPEKSGTYGQQLLKAYLREIGILGAES